MNNGSVLAAKNIMTGLNVAFTIPGDSFVPEKFDTQLTASLPEFAAELTQIVFTSLLHAQGRPA